jgi:hypothetical protein
MSEKQSVSQYCIYTMLHKQKLAEIFRSGGVGEAKEKKVWKEGQRLFLEAQKNEERMPVVFNAADTGGGLIYYAFLAAVEIDKDDSSTTYKFTQLTKLEDKLPLSSLKLKSTNQPLSNDYIRPYAICYTPSFIKEES